MAEVIFGEFLSAGVPVYLDAIATVLTKPDDSATFLLRQRRAVFQEPESGEVFCKARPLELNAVIHPEPAAPNPLGHALTFFHQVSFTARRVQMAKAIMRIHEDGWSAVW